MELRMGNILAAVLLLMALWITIRTRQPLRKAVSCMVLVGPGHDWKDQIIGVLMFGLLCLLIVAITKILTHSNRP